MTIGRSQIPMELEGGDIMKDMDKKYNDIDVFQDGGIAAIEMPDYEQSFKQYQERLMPYVYQEPRMSIYDLASELGAGLLATPNVGGTSLFQGLGTGFARASDRLKAAKAQNDKARQQIALQAAQMAMQDEQQAKSFLQEYSLKQIDARNKPGEIIRLEYTDPNTGETVERSFFNNSVNKPEIEALLKQGANVVKTPASQTIINQGREISKRDEKAIDQQYKLEATLEEAYSASIGVLDNVAEAKAAANRLTNNGQNPEKYGPVQSFLLGPKKILAGTGLGDALNIDPAEVGDQIVLNQLGMNFTMAIVSQTKGAISNKEMDLFINASPGLASTYDGYQKQLAYLERIARRDQEMYQDFQEEAERLEALEDAGELTPSQVNRKLKNFYADWPEKNPLFSAEERKELEDRIKNKTGLAQNYDVGKERATAKALIQEKNKQPIQSPDVQTAALIEKINNDATLSDAQKEELIAELLK